MSYDIDLSGRVAMVTGASGGLGAQFARTLSKAGAGVVLAARRTDGLTANRPLAVADYDMRAVDWLTSGSLSTTTSGGST